MRRDMVDFEQPANLRDPGTEFQTQTARPRR